MIIAFRDFQDQEYLVTKQILETAGAEIITASDSLGRAIGVFGAAVNVGILIQNLDIENFDAAVFIGGGGMAQHIDDPNFHQIARAAARAGKILGAICIAPCALARAGVLENKRATVWHSEMDKSPVKILQDSSAIFVDEPVVADGNIITANGPPAAQTFAQRLTEMLE